MIPTVHDGELAPVERCCFCDKRTNYWHADKDVAVCLVCAQRRKVAEIPTKREWCEAQRAKRTRRTPPTPGGPDGAGT